MRLPLALAAVLIVTPTYAKSAAHLPPYDGLWGTSPAACRDQDGADRMEITAGRFFWYETRCHALVTQALKPRSWIMKLSCEGEGRHFASRPRITMPEPGKLIMDNAPVGPTTHQVYVRCRR